MYPKIDIRRGFCKKRSFRESNAAGGLGHSAAAPNGQRVDGPDVIELKAGESYEVRFK